MSTKLIVGLSKAERECYTPVERWKSLNAGPFGVTQRSVIIVDADVAVS